MPMHLKGGYRSKNGMVTYGKQKKYKPGGENKAGLKKLVKMAKDKFGITAKVGKEKNIQVEDHIWVHKREKLIWECLQIL